MRSVYRTVVVKKELSRKDKIADTSGRNEFPSRRVAGCSLRDRVRSSDTQEELGVEPLLLRMIERSQLRVARASVLDAPWTPPWEVFQAWPTGRRPQGKTQDTLERLCLSAGLGNASEFPLEELEEVSG
ncbi:hypothetical protein L3Q82_018535, partial [Scortum barcoo]